MKKLIALTLVCVALAFSGSAQVPNNPVNSLIREKPTYEAWKNAAKTQIRLNPKYGYAVKTPQQKASDEQLINGYVKQEGSRRKGAQRLTKTGFEYNSKGDPITAMYRFNQAWLLDSTEASVYSGFASIYLSFKDYPKAIELLDQGLVINPKSSQLLNDKATTYLIMARTSRSKKDLEKGLSLLKESYAFDPNNENTVYKLSTYYFDANNCNLAVKYYKECMKLGGRSVIQRYKDALKSKCGI